MAFMEPTCLLIFPIPSHQHIIAWISQLSYSVGRREVILDVKFYCSHTIFKRIHLDHLLTSLSPGFRPHLQLYTSSLPYTYSWSASKYAEGNRVLFEYFIDQQPQGRVKVDDRDTNTVYCDN